MWPQLGGYALSLLGGGGVVALLQALFSKRKIDAEASRAGVEAVTMASQVATELLNPLREELRHTHANLREARQEIQQLRVNMEAMSVELESTKRDLRVTRSDLQIAQAQLRGLGDA